MYELLHGREHDPPATTGRSAPEEGLDVSASPPLVILPLILSQVLVLPSLMAKLAVTSGRRPTNCPGGTAVAARVVPAIGDDGLPLRLAPRSWTWRASLRVGAP